jgi:DNA-binding GntR family transcriptional regulator
MVGRLHDRLARFMVLRHAGKTMLMTHAKIIDTLIDHNPTNARQALLADIDDTYYTVLDKVIEEELDSVPLKLVQRN